MFFPEGRGYAGSDGPTLNECRTIADVIGYLQGRSQDVIAGVDWLAEQSWADEQRIAISGCSHGAVVTLFAAASGRFRSVIAQAPGASVSHPEAGLVEMIDAVTRTEAPILLQHALDDTLCPHTNSERILRAGRQAQRSISLRSYDPIEGMEGHSQFNYEYRRIWAGDFNKALASLLRSSRLI